MQLYVSVIHVYVYILPLSIGIVCGKHLEGHNLKFLQGLYLSGRDFILLFIHCYSSLHSLRVFFFKMELLLLLLEKQFTTIK